MTVHRDASILIVEDEPQVLELLALCLREAGYRTVTAANGLDAIGRLESAHFDLAVIDYRLPDLLGTAVAFEAVKLRPAIRILFITAYMEFADSPLRGQWRVLVKPFKGSQFVRSIEEVLAEIPCR